ncbi:MAG: hypothetical protein NZ898_16980, partial [Myxococcota bacterium]|nr:hypothetical protein [Myxococcota bacterium]
TGTNGKTTTTLLTHHILRTMGLKARLCGNIAGTAGDLTLTEAADAAAPDAADGDAGTSDAGTPTDGGARDAAAGGDGAASACSGATVGVVRVRVGEALPVTAACSYAPSGGRLLYTWRLVEAPAGSRAQITDPSRANPAFIPDVPGRYRLDVVVSDGVMSSKPAVLEVHAEGCTARWPEPTVRVQPATPALGTAVSLEAVLPAAGRDGCTLVDEDVRYAWTLAGRPAGSSAALTSEVLPTTSFVPDVPGTYVVRLWLHAPSGEASSPPVDTVVEVPACGGTAPEVSARVVSTASHVGASIQLEAQTSDADTTGSCGAHPPWFRWHWAFVELPAGSRAVLNDVGARNPSFVADVAGRYLLRVVATDPTGLSSPPAEVEAMVATCGTANPVVRAIDVEGATGVGAAVRLNATVDDSDVACGAHAAGFTIRWSFDELPRGSSAAWNDPGAWRPSFVADVTGRYVVRATVTDPTGRTGSLTRSVDVGTCGTNTPTVSASASASSVRAGEGVQLRATIADPDTQPPCSLTQRVNVRWRLVELPAGSTAALSAPDADRPSLLTDVPGTYVAEVVATDSTDRSSAPARVTVTASACGSAPPNPAAQKIAPLPIAACGGAPISVAVGSTVQLDAAGSSDPDNGAGCAAGQSLFFHWTLLVAPAGSASWLSATEARAPWFIPDRAGEYRVRLLVTDSTGLTGRELVCVLNAS